MKFRRACLLAAIGKERLLKSREKMPPEIHLVFRLGQALGFFPFTVDGDSRRLAFNWYRILSLKGLRSPDMNIANLSGEVARS